jgi:hypothetical protein
MLIIKKAATEPTAAARIFVFVQQAPSADHSLRSIKIPLAKWEVSCVSPEAVMMVCLTSNIRRSVS